VKNRNFIMGIVSAAALAVMTESVLLLGYVVAGTTLLMIATVAVRRVLRRGPRLARRQSHTRWLDVSDREAA
jgi:hypothetical protein